MDIRLHVRVIYFIFLGCTATITAMDNDVVKMQFIDLPADSIERIGSLLDHSSNNALAKSCKTCFSILANPFAKLPMCTRERILKNCSQYDLIRLWRSCHFCYLFCISHNIPFVIRSDNYFPSRINKNSPTQQMTTHLVKLISSAHRRAIPVSLNLKLLAFRLDIDSKLLFPALFEMLAKRHSADSIVELDLSHNFTSNLLVSLLHSQCVRSIRQTNPFAVETICSAANSFPNLTKLVLDRNDLIAIPHQLSRLKLQILSLAWNYLNLHSIGPCRDLTSLTELNLARNFLTSIPNSLPPNLRILDVTDNPLDQETQRRLNEEKSGKHQLTIIFRDEV